MEKELVVLPTYNERENIGKLIPEIFQHLPQAHVLVIDDSSPDGTGELAHSLARQYPQQLFIKVRPGKMGLGTAYLAGFRYALERDYRYIFEMDADFSHAPKDLPRLKEAAAHADLVLGSRYVKGGGIENWGIGRHLISRGGNFYSRLILGLSVRDLTGGFKCFRRELLESLMVDEVQSEGYAFQVELTYRALRKGFRIAEVPIRFVDRKVGKSKMSRRIFWEASWRIWKLRFMALRGEL